MTPRLEQHIKKELYNKRFFDIPGIGSFHLKREAAKFSEDKATIYPPNYHVQFSEVINGGVDNAYKDELHLLSERVLKEINAVGKSKIRGLGIFQKENGKFNFYPDKELEKAFTLGLEPIYNVHEVSKSYVGTPTKVAETLVVSKPKRDFSNLQKGAKIFGWLLLGIGLLYALLNIPITLNDNNTPVIKEIKVTKAPTVEAKVDESNQIVSPPTIDTVANIQKSPDTVESASRNNNEVVKEQENLVQKSEVKMVKNNKTKSNVKQIRSKIVIPKPKVDSNEISPITGKACAVITGSFKTSMYALKMVKRLQKLGYKVYTEEKQGTTRIGLLYDCTKTNADSLLRDVRSKIDTTSWILE